ncbi:hypothetical protein Y032_0061g3205 [Ancylostoma ceylanicum]|uniref:Cadherin domain-containing protein n=1 Tax=Ancylostoma ceylanicum TaxID=53326 RepID=A0A016U252_9BILA|nr:hypothetical protein Y032_0061g3205 [Ancylostoma ceylanicum]
MVLLQLVLLILLRQSCLGDVGAESSNGVVSVEATSAPGLPFLFNNDLVIGRASNKMILAELSAEETNSTANSSFEDNSAEKSEEEARSESSTESTSRRPLFEFMPQFEHSSYDFMVPEGSNPESTVLAVISYLGRKDQPMPIFKISFDRMRWFEIGDVMKKELDNYIEYKVTINQRADVYVQYNLTKNGSYKFSVEAHDAGTMHTASIRVDVLSLSPTTRRSTTSTTSTTVTSELPTTVEVLVITTPLVTTAKSSESTTESEHSTTNIVELSSEDGTTSSNSPQSLPLEPTTLPETTESSHEMQTTLAQVENEEITSTLSDEEENSDFTLPTTSPESSAEVHLTPDLSQSQNSAEERSTVDPQPSEEPQSTTLFKKDLEVTSEDSNIEIQEGSGTAPEISSTQRVGEDSSAPVESTTQESNEVLKIVVEGTEEGKFNVDGALKKGSMIRGLAISITSTGKKKHYTKLSLEGSDAFDVRPKQLYSGNKAYLFLENPSSLSSSSVITITAEGKNSTATKEITIIGASSSDDVVEHESNLEKTVDVVKHNFSISERAPSGSTVGQIKDGDSKKVIGPPGLFSLIGSDLILSCPDEGSCLDYEKQRAHHVLLVDAHGKKAAPVHVKIDVVDVNDNPPRLEASDNFIRLSNNRLIMPFLVQVMDDDGPSANKNHLSLSGSATNFLALSKLSEGLYQVEVVGFAPAGVHQLEISVSDGESSDTVSVEVQVQNSRSHARFRRSKYSRTITADKVHEGNQLLQVELEGVPIDEARFVILQGNPGWLSIDDYGGRVGVAKFIEEVEAGRYSVEIGAVDRQSNALLAQTRLEIKVIGGAESEKKVFEQSFFERTLDRETSSEFSVPFKTHGNVPVTAQSTFAIDENGQQREFDNEAVTIKDNEVVFEKSALADLRAVSVQLLANGEKATVMLSLTSSPEFIENRRQESARPIFPQPWTKENNLIEVSIPEELPAGSIIYSLPAINPLDGSSVPVAVQGDVKEAFSVDPDTGAISIAHRLDLESMASSDRTFSLTFTAGSPGYESVAELRITVTNIDDNPPVLDKEGLHNEVAIPENLPPLTVIARLGLTDADDLENSGEFSVEKSGFGSELYTASIVNGSLVVSVAENATLDREKMERQTVHLRVKDAAGNQDSATLSIHLLDVNDNAPRFSQDQYAMQVVENWPAGIVVDRMRATDGDTGKNSRVIYSLATDSARHFAVDATTGELSVAQELAGAAREQPYELVVVAEDAGDPSLSSSVRIKLKVSEPLTQKEGEKGQVIFINPPVEYVLKIKEDTPVNEHIYNVKARLAGMGEERMNIKYSLKDLSSDVQYFDIDESSGEVYVTRALDFESTKYYSVSSTDMSYVDELTYELGQRDAIHVRRPQ